MDANKSSLATYFERSPAFSPRPAYDCAQLTSEDCARLVGIRERQLVGQDDVEDVRAAVGRVEELYPGRHPHRASWLKRLGDALYGRYGRRRDLLDIDDAIWAYRCAIGIASPNHPELPTLHNDLGVSLRDRFERLQEPDDIDDAISALRRASDLIPHDHPHKSSFLNNLGSSLCDRFERLGGLTHIDESILVLRRAIALVPDGFPSKATLLTNLANSLGTRFRRRGELSDLENALSAQRYALTLTLDDHPDKPGRLDILGGILQSRFERLGQRCDIDEAITLRRRAVAPIPDGHPQKATFLNNLGSSLYVHCRSTVDALSDIDGAISSQRQAVALTPEGHPSKPGYLTNLGNMLSLRFERLQELKDLEESCLVQRRAVELIPDGHPEKPAMLNNLGRVLSRRFGWLGQVCDIEGSILAQRRAVDLVPDEYSGKPLYLSNLADVLRSHFFRFGELRSLEEAISAQRCAVELTPDGHQEKPDHLHALGNIMRTRFYQLRELRDIEDATLVQRLAVELTHDEHTSKPCRLNDLGTSLLHYFELCGMSSDIEEAILVQRRAVELTSDGDTYKPVALGCLADSFHGHFYRFGELHSIEEATSLYRRAADLTPDGHPHRLARLHNLGSALFTRFEHLGELKDLEESITSLQLAVVSLPDGHPEKPKCQISLALSLRARFQRQRNINDFHAAVSQFTESTLRPLGAPSIRLFSAKCCIAMASSNLASGSFEPLLAAHSRIFDVLPEIVWLGSSIDRRYEESAQVGELVHAAVAAAISAGSPVQAIEWLEAGRSLIWSQVLSLRTPLDDLQGSHPKLAESLHEIQTRLQLSAHITFAANPKSLREVPGLATNAAADRHRELAIEFDSLLNQIRSLPGFKGFLRPKRLDTLIPSTQVMGGPIVFINVDKTRCDALLLSPSGEVTVVPLSDLSYERAVELRHLWIIHTTGGKVRSRGSSVSWANERGGRIDPLMCILGHLWNWIVSPVLNALHIGAASEAGRHPPSHITWCPTGALMQLPLHAAGVYAEPDGPRLYQTVVSSYIPSLTALVRCYQKASEPHSKREVLIVTQPATPNHSPLPGTLYEGWRLKASLGALQIANKWLNNDAATVKEVRSSMSRYPWVHLACHGFQNRDDLTKSAFELFDGSLTLSDIMGTTGESNELAFLSACQTAVGDEKTPEESAHLAAGMLSVGFKAVVATMWSIQDADAPLVVDVFYKKLLALHEFGNLGVTGAADALHEATRALRDEAGETDFIRWVPFVHFGI
ncbi:unnamed protein product [Peniophora sp. CBMAI 1063]|nr:unnamed protein product [Peniophora sp. CBMAI 1063]